MAEHILRVQSAPSFAGLRINLEGVAIGNGMIDFVVQEASYAEYAYYHGLIPLQTKMHMDRIYAQCLLGLEVGGSVDRGSFGRCNLMGRVLEAAGRPNEYNTNTFNSYDVISSPEGIFHHFFNDPEVQTMLHVRGWDVPGINFRTSAVNTANATGSGKNGSVWFQPEVWAVCNNNIVSAP
jgi:hypothetical protein